MISVTSFIKNYTSNASDLIIDALYLEIISEEDQKLLDITFSKNIQQSKLDEFLQSWDIEKFGGIKSLLLSYVMKENPNLKFSMYEKPRLEGLLKYHRFHNLKLISHYVKIVKELNKRNIFPMIMKGGAMKHIRPELSRPMGDIDILILEESKFLEASKICQNLGYVFDWSLEGHSIDLHLPESEEGIVDIHRYIYFEAEYDKEFLKELFSRSNKEKVFGTETFVPSFEDMVFLGMINLSRNLHSNTSVNGILYSLFDFKYLSKDKANFNWNIVLQNIIKTNTHTQALLAMKFINKIVPNTLPESLLDNNIINNNFSIYCNRVMFNHFYFDELKAKCKKLKIKSSLTSIKNIKNFLANKPKYFLLKRIVRKSNFLIKIFLIINNKKQKNF